MPKPEISIVKDELGALVGEYNLKSNILGKNEAQTRLSLIDPFWEILGWNVRDPIQVKVEKTIRASELDFSDDEKRGNKRADYTFFTGFNKEAFVVEAKKPKVSLHDEKVINQLKKYGFTMEIDVGILHDFEEFRPFDTAFPVTNHPEAHLIKEFDIEYQQYPDYAEKLLNTFGREAVLDGSIQELVGRVRRGKPVIKMDEIFLDLMGVWRRKLAEGLAHYNPDYSDHDINEYVGRILNRIIFLRVVEARNAIPTGSLETEWNRYQKEFKYGVKIKLIDKLMPFFEKMNDVFNGVLFKPSPLDKMRIPSNPIHDMLDEIYNPLFTYDFSVIKIEILGSIYERFLGEVIIRDEKTTKIDVIQKPEVKKSWRRVLHTKIYC